MTTALLRRTAALAVVALACAAPALAQAPLRIGEVRPYHAESPHPYPLGSDARPVVWTDRVISPGAEFVRLHFANLHLAPGDFLTVSRPDGSQASTYSGRGPHGDGDLWALAVEGDTAVVQIHGGRGNGQGYLIDAVGHGTVALNAKRVTPTPEVICGTDGRENVACYTSDPVFDAAQRAVARLQWIQGAFIYSCTGWLASGANPSTMVTNNHCFSTQKVTQTVEADFNFQRTTCTGTNNGTISAYFGGTFLKTNGVDRKGSRGGLDYTLFTLLGNPAATWGQLAPTTKLSVVNDLIWFIQHGGGNEKTVGVFEDANHLTRCAVDLIDQTYAKSAPGSQTAYACDSEGGASGSPIVDPATGHVVALHHFGGVGSNPCLNSGTEMSSICADAGTLLSCASN